MAAKEIPVLAAGRVRLDDPDSFLAHHRSTLCRGGLSVRSALPLEPLTPTDMVLEIPGGREVPLVAEVVTCRDDVYMLRLHLDEATRAALDAVAKALQPPEESAVPASVAPPAAPQSPALEEGWITVASVAELQQLAQELRRSGGAMLLNRAPLPDDGLYCVRLRCERWESTYPTTARLAMIQGEQIALVFDDLAVFQEATAALGADVGSSEPAKAPPPAPSAAARLEERPAPPAEAPRPAPTLENGVVVVQEHADLAALRREIEQSGGLMAHAVGTPPRFGATPIRFALRGQEPGKACSANVVFAQDRQVAFVFESPERALSELLALEGAASAGPAAGPAANPPTFQRDRLHFGDRADIDAAIAEIGTTHGLMAQTSGASPPFGRLTLYCTRPDGVSSVALAADVVLAQGAQVALVFAEPAAAQDALLALRDASSVALAETGPRAARREVRLPPRALPCPDSPPALLRLRLLQPPDPLAADAATLFELLLGLRNLRATATLRLADGDAALELPMKAGVLLLSDEEREQLTDWFGRPRLRTEVAPGLPARLGSDKRPRDVRKVVGDGVRRVLRELRTEDLELGLASWVGRYPVPAEGVNAALMGLALDPKEARLLDKIMDGTRALGELPKVSGMLRPATFRAFYLFILFGLIELLDEARYDAGEDPAQRYAAECRQLVQLGPFAQLGIHWSAHPTEIYAALTARRQRFGPGGPVAARCPAQAREALAAVERAGELLRSSAGRVRARQDLGSLDLKAAAHILAKHAELAQIRGEFEAARCSLEMALELAPRQEYKGQLDRLRSLS